MLRNSRAPRAPSGSPANESELPLLPQELPQETPQETPQVPQEVSDALRLRLRELPPGQVKRVLIAHVRHCRNRWRCGTCRAARELLARRISSRQAVAS